MPITPMTTILMMLMTAAALGDTVTMKDGRHFEGEIIEQSPTVVVLDAMVAGIRATLPLKRAAIEQIDVEPVAPDFYEPRSKVDARVSNRAEFAYGDELFLEVPVVGQIGQAIHEASLRRVLAYAKRYRVNHIVFRIDSSGGDIEEARRIGRLLLDYEDELTYHALVRKCRGSALAFVLVADRVQLLPGASLGGPVKPDAGPAYDADQLMREQIARNVAQYMEGKGKSGLLAMALFDPSVEVAVWLDDDGIMQQAASAPESLSGDKIIIRNGPEELLVVTADQAYKLGMPRFDGNVDAYGRRVLGLESWRAESDFGARTIRDHAISQQKRAADRAQQAERLITKNITRRKLTQRNIEHNIAQAKTWDPAGGDYATMNTGWERDWINDAYRYRRSPYLTTDSQREWQRRTDLTVSLLNKAVRGIQAMKRLDAEAERLSLEPTYPEGELENMLEATRVRIGMLKANREKRTQ